MRINFVEIEETRNWSEKIQNTAGKLYGVYTYNPRQVVNCCELTPSYELIRVDTHGDILQ